MKRAWEDTQAMLHLTNERMIMQAAKRHRPAPQYKPGNRVWLDRTNLKTLEPTAKLDDKNIGPFFVRAQSGSSLYQLWMTERYKHVHNTFHETLLRPYIEPEADHQKVPLPPRRVHLASRPDEEHWEVEAILDVHRAGPKGVKFLVSYVDQPIERNEWIISSDIVLFSPDLVNAFYRDPAHADLCRFPRPNKYLVPIRVPPCVFPRVQVPITQPLTSLPTSPSTAAATLASSGTRALSTVTPKPKNNKTLVVVPPDIASDNDHDPFTTPHPMSPLTTGIDYLIPGPNDIRYALSQTRDLHDS